MPLKWIFHFTFCVLQLHDFCFNIFYLCWNCLCFVLLTSVSFFMIVLLNFLSGKSLPTLSLLIEKWEVVVLVVCSVLNWGGREHVAAFVLLQVFKLSWNWQELQDWQDWSLTSGETLGKLGVLDMWTNPLPSSGKSWELEGLFPIVWYYAGVRDSSKRSQISLLV